MKISCEFGEPSRCSFPLKSVNAENLSTRGGGVANAKPKYPPDASGGYNNQLQQPISLWLPGQYILGQGQIEAGFKISADLPVCNQQKSFRVEKIRTLPVCPKSCKMVIHAHFTQLNYDLHVFDIVQPHLSDLILLCEDLRLLPF